MAKNNDLINRYKLLNLRVQQIVPEVYAAVALTLYRDYEWTYEQINDLFGLTQEKWEYYSDMHLDMIQICSEETGIELRSK
jgi:hypothetical protein